MPYNIWHLTLKCNAKKKKKLRLGLFRMKQIVVYGFQKCMFEEEKRKLLKEDKFQGFKYTKCVKFNCSTI